VAEEFGGAAEEAAGPLLSPAVQAAVLRDRTAANVAAAKRLEQRVRIMILLVESPVAPPTFVADARRRNPWMQIETL
jgi:hypothetical protein